MSDSPTFDLVICGSKTPDIRFTKKDGDIRIFCLNNLTLDIRENMLGERTFKMGTLLSFLCQKHCKGHRQGEQQPCPALVKAYKVHTEKRNLASVEMHSLPQWDKCAGVKYLLDLTDTKDERAFLRAYLDQMYADECHWRDGLIAKWNASWHRVPDNPWAVSRVSKFDRMLWSTLRFPALLPQAWINWLYGADEAALRRLDTCPSRIDFMAIHEGRRHVVEIDGPSHWADHDGHGYVPNEDAYHRTIVHRRTLERENWVWTTLTRKEVKEASANTEEFLPWVGVLSVLPFYRMEYPEPLSPEQLGVTEIEDYVFDDIPF